MRKQRQEALTVTRCLMRGYSYSSMEKDGEHDAEHNCSVLSKEYNYTIDFQPTDFNLGELPMSDNTNLDLEDLRAQALSMYVAILMAAGKPTSDVSIEFLKTYTDAEILALVIEKMHEVLAKVVEHKGG